MNWLLYLLQASLFFILFYGAYWLLLRKETYHQLNRGILLGVLLGVTLLPLAPVPDQVVMLGEEYLPLEQVPTIDIQPLLIEDSTPAVAETNAINVDWKLLLFYLYLAGLLWSGSRFLIAMGAVWSTLLSAKIKRSGTVLFAYSEKDFQPFSFLNIICLGANYHHLGADDQIVKHERIHAQQIHSIDILLVELFAVFFWFHPFTILLKRSIKLNLEYIADKAVLASGVNRKIYQYGLLKVSALKEGNPLTNNFNQSFLKKRIIMMNGKKSPEWKKWKYLLFLPLLVLSYAYMSATTQTEQTTKDLALVEKDKNKDKDKDKSKDKNKQKEKNKTTSNIKNDVLIVIGQDMRKSDLEDVQAKAKALGIDLTFHKLDYNSNGKLSGISMDAVIQYNDNGGVVQHNVSLFPRGVLQEKIIVYRIGGEKSKPLMGLTTDNQLPEGLPEKYAVLVERVQGIAIDEKE